MDNPSMDSTHSGRSTPAGSAQALNDLLAALPEMFPGEQDIPLPNIRPNPKNPGWPLTDPEIQDLAQNIAEAGLLNPAKFQPDKANPLTRGVQIHPINPRLRADGQPWTVGDFNYVILAGENRYRAFERLKRATIPGLILNPTAKEAVKITHLDNEVRDRGWWAAYQTIEQYIQADPNLTQRQVAVKLKIALPKVNRALGLLPLLNPASRELIVTNSNNSNKGNKGISENAAAQLADLGPGTGLKPGVKAVGAETQKLWPYPAIPPETQDLVRRALEVAWDEGMTEGGVKSLVGWVKQGNAPETFTLEKAPKAKRQSTVDSPQSTASPKAHQAKPQPEIVHQPEGLSMVGQGPTTTSLAQTTPMDSTPEIGMVRPSNHSPRVGAAESLFWDGLAGVSVISRIKAKIKKGEKPAWWEAILLAGHALGRAVIWLAHHAYKLVRPLFKLAGRLVLDALKSIARLFGRTFYQAAKVVMMVVLLVGLAWIGWDVYKHGIFHPIRVIESKFLKEQPKPQVITAPVPSPQPALSDFGHHGEPAVSLPALSLSKGSNPSNGPTPAPMASIAGSPAEPARQNPEAQPEVSAQSPQDGKQAAPSPGLPPKGVPHQQGISVSSAAASAQPTVQPVPTVQKNDVLGQAVGSVGKQVGAGVAGDLAKKLFGL